jgi:hypothetical protein
MTRLPEAVSGLVVSDTWFGWYGIFIRGFAQSCATKVGRAPEGLRSRHP